MGVHNKQFLFDVSSFFIMCVYKVYIMYYLIIIYLLLK